MKKITCIILLFSAVFVKAQTKEQTKKILATYDINSLVTLKSKMKQQELEDKQNVEAFLKANKNTEKRTSNTEVLMRTLKDGTPIYYDINNNTNCAAATRADELNSGGGLNLTLDGQGMVPRVWDGDAVLSSHIEFNNGGLNRVSLGDDSSLGNRSFHATHVMGTILSAGSNEPRSKGMASKATSKSFDFASDKSEVVSEIMDGMIISNHSYGAGFDNSTPAWYIGGYTKESRNWDEITYNAPYYQPIVSAGNDGGSNSNSNPIRNNYDKLTGYAVSKNLLVIANAAFPTFGPDGVATTSQIAASSSQGPSDDGRVKPDLSGMGLNVYSTSYNGSFSNNIYSNQSGTSMSAPNVTGTLTLVQQHYNNTYGRFMKSETLRALAINTAADLSNPILGLVDGPDARFGWGYLDGRRCVDAINGNGNGTYISETELVDQNTYTYTVIADGAGKLNATIAWTDPASSWVNDDDQIANNPRAALVNDLDITVTEAVTSTVFYPWRLSLNDVSAPALRDSDNLVDNIEKVTIDNPIPGRAYTITVTHKGNLFNGKQSFGLVVTGLTNSSFAFYPTDTNKSVCTSANAVFNFDYEQITSGTTTFSAVNMPAGMTVNFNNPTMSANGTLTATFGGLNNVAPGTYNVFVEGVNGTDKERRSIFIKVFSSEFSDSVAVSPANGATTGSYYMDLVWQKDTNALSSLVELSDDINFTNIIASVTTTTNSVTVSDLVEGNVYYWRVIGTNNCGTATAPYNVNNFQVGAQDCFTVFDDTGWPIPEIAVNIPFLRIEKVVNDNITITDLNVTVNLEHEYLGDVEIFLRSPSGTTVKLLEYLDTCNGSTTGFGYMALKFDNAGNAYNCNNQVNNYPTVSPVLPTEPLTNFIGENTQGTWTLLIADLGLQDSGNLLSFGLEFCKPKGITPMPNLIRNNDITIGPLSEHIYDNATDLEVTSTSETAVQQVFTVVELPTLGHLKLNNVTLALGDTFTQNDINNSNFKYVNTASSFQAVDATDFFVVNVLNNANGWLSNQRVNINIDNSLSVKTNTLKNIAVYPNPASTHITLSTPNSLDIKAISIIDVQGRILQTITNFNITNNNIILDVSNMSDGAYFLNIKSANSETVKRIIKN